MQLIKNMVSAHTCPFFFTTTIGGVYNLQDLRMNPKAYNF